METPWMDSSTAKKHDLAPDARCKKGQSRSDCSLDGVSYQGMGISLEFPLTAHCLHLYDNSFLEFCHYPVGLPTELEDIRCTCLLGLPARQGRLYSVLLELHEMTFCIISDALFIIWWTSKTHFRVSTSAQEY